METRYNQVVTHVYNFISCIKNRPFLQKFNDAPQLVKDNVIAYVIDLCGGNEELYQALRGREYEEVHRLIEKHFSETEWIPEEVKRDLDLKALFDFDNETQDMVESREKLRREAMKICILTTI
jgi:hypothetical protein